MVVVIAETAAVSVALPRRDAVDVICLGFLLPLFLRVRCLDVVASAVCSRGCHCSLPQAGTRLVADAASYSLFLCCRASATARVMAVVTRRATSVAPRSTVALSATRMSSTQAAPATSSPSAALANKLAGANPGPGNLDFVAALALAAHKFCRAGAPRSCDRTSTHSHCTALCHIMQRLMLLPAGISSRLLRKASRPRLPQCCMLCPQCQ